MKIVKIGTRGSKLAVWQAEYISNCLKKEGLETEIQIINTKGDQILNKSLSKIGSKGVFTQELEDALINKQIDIAVHSAKDMPTTLPTDLEIISYTKREIVNDALISDQNITLDAPNLVVGTSSTRRVALLKHYFPNIKIVDMRGNLQTRVAKMREGACDALLLAYAGAFRMEFGSMIKQIIDTDIFVPPVGQGTLAIEANKNLEKSLKTKIVNATSDQFAEYQMAAETTFLRLLNGGCSIPVFGNATITNNILKLTGGIVSLDGTTLVKESVEGKLDEGDLLGLKLFEVMKLKGGIEILNKIKNNVYDKN